MVILYLMEIGSRSEVSLAYISEVLGGDVGDRHLVLYAAVDLLFLEQQPLALLQLLVSPNNCTASSIYRTVQKKCAGSAYHLFLLDSRVQSWVAIQ